MAPRLAVPGSLAVEGGETGRGRRRTSGLHRVEVAQTEMIDVATLPVVVLPVVVLQGVPHPGVPHLHPRKVAAPGGGRDRTDQTGQTGHHQDVTGDSRDKEPGDKVDLVAEAEILVATEDLHQGVMVVMFQLDAHLTVMFGGVEELEGEELRIGLRPEEVDVIVTLVVLEEADVIATLEPEIPLLPVVTTPDLEMTDPLTGVKVRPVLLVESAVPSLERRGLEKRGLERRNQERRNREKDQLANQMTAGPKSSVNLCPIKHFLGRISFFGGNSRESFTERLKILLPRLPA